MSEKSKTIFNATAIAATVGVLALPVALSSLAVAAEAQSEGINENTPNVDE